MAALRDRALLKVFLQAGAICAAALMSACDASSVENEVSAQADTSDGNVSGDFSPAAVCADTSVLNAAKGMVASNLDIEGSEFEIDSTSLDGFDENTKKVQCVGLFKIGGDRAFPINFTAQPTADQSDVLIFVNITPDIASFVQSYNRGKALNAFFEAVRDEKNAERQAAAAKESEESNGAEAPETENSSHSNEP